MARTLSRRLGAGAAAVGALAVAVMLVSASVDSPPDATAGPSLHVSPTGSDSGSCTADAPCSSWNAAYGRARPGQVVEVAGGSYPGQEIRSRAALRSGRPGCAPAARSACVVFVPAPGARVRVEGSLVVRGSGVWVDGGSFTGMAQRGRRYAIDVAGAVSIEAESESDTPDHVVLTGIHSSSFGVFNVDTAYLGSMDVGPATVSTGCQIRQGPGFENKIGFGGGITKVPTNVTLDRLVVHNQNGDQGRIQSDCHFGGLFLVTADGLVIRNSLFTQNVVYNIQVQNFGGAPPPRNVTIENNAFGCPVEWTYVSETTCDNQADIQFNAASPFANWLIRHNSLLGGIGQYVAGASYENVRVLGNAGVAGPCLRGVTYGYNAWTGGRCGGTDRRLVSVPFADATPGRESFELRPATPAAALVPGDAPDLGLATDAEGRARPLAFPRDAGAVQRDTAVIAPRGIGSVRIGMPREAVARTYGEPLRSRPAAIPAGAGDGVVEAFRVPGGTLEVTIVGGRVAGVATASAYYTTPAGAGPGRPFGTVAGRSRETCRTSVRLHAGDVATVFARRATGSGVGVVSVVRRSLLAPCDRPGGGRPRGAKAGQPATAFTASRW